MGLSRNEQMDKKYIGEIVMAQKKKRKKETEVLTVGVKEEQRVRQMKSDQAAASLSDKIWKENDKENDKETGNTGGVCSEKHSAIPGLHLELESLRVEYHNQFDRSNKLDNKVYITITFCGFLFVFITGLFTGISQVQRPEGWLMTGITMLYLISCLAVIFSYVYLLIFFMRLLRPEHIIRMDPEIMEREHLDALNQEQAYRKMIQLYREVININLDKLKLRCDEFTGGLRYVIVNVIFAFLAYGLQIFMQMTR